MTFLDFPRWSGYIQVRWANVQATYVNFSQDVTYRKSLQSVIFEKSYLKNKKLDVFWDTVYILVNTKQITVNSFLKSFIKYSNLSKWVV